MPRFVWWLYGWLRRPLVALDKRLRPSRRWRYLRSDCPHCGYDAWTEHRDLFFCEHSGVGFNHEFGQPEHWFYGMQGCARCGTTHPYGDSSL